MIRFPLETERLLLRPLRLRDAPDLHEVYSDHKTMQYLTSDVPKTLDETRGWLRPKMEQQQRDGISLWSVVLRDGGKVIGDCGLQWRDETKSVPELGFRLNRAYWGHGYAIEAARATLDAAFDQLGVSCLVAVTDVKNDRARRLIEQLGLRYVRETHWYGRRMTEYEIHAPPSAPFFVNPQGRLRKRE